MGGFIQVNPSRDDIKQREKESRSKKSRRFWLPSPDKGGQDGKQVIFLDDDFTCIWEHQLKINDSWDNFFTCRQGVDPDDPRCPLCESGVKKYYVGFLTCLDATGWTTRKGEKVLYQRQLFPMKTETLKKVMLLKDTKTSLVGAKYHVRRVGDRAATSGDMFDFMEYTKPFDDEQFWFQSRIEGKKKPPEVFDYEDIFAPLSFNEMVSYVDGSRAGGQSPGKGGSGGGDNDVPY
jgi:hypothetical protein